MRSHVPGIHLSALARSLLRGAWVVLLLTSGARTAWAYQGWTQIDSPDVRIVSDLSPRQMRKIAAEIAIYRSVVGEFFPSWKFTSSVRPTLFIVDSGLWKGYVRGGESDTGVTFSLPVGDFIALDGDHWDMSHSVVFHELSHHFLNVNNRGNRFPVWYREGLAEFLSTARIWWSVGGTQIELGLAPPMMIEGFAARHWLPLSIVFSVTHESKAYHDPALASLFYAESWLLVHYAFVGDPTWTPAMARYLAAFSAGHNAKDAFAAALPGDHGEFEAKLQKYVFQNYLPLVRRPVPKMQPPEITERSLSEAEGRLMLGRYLTQVASTRKSTTAFLEESARRAGPDSPAAVLLAAFLSRDRSVAATRTPHSACSESTVGAELLALCGDVEVSRADALIGHAQSGEPTAESVAAAEAARRFYDRARGAGDSSTATLLSYGATQVLAPGGDPTVRGRLEEILGESPGNHGLAELVADLWLREDPRHSLKLLEGALRDADTSEAVDVLLQDIHQAENQVAIREAAATQAPTSTTRH
jgi:hypothetical protein